jgi:hypothetical protein
MTRGPVRNVDPNACMILTTTVPVGRSIHELADACRNALTAFTTMDRTLGALAIWLEGPYRTALVRHTGRIEMSLTRATAPAAIEGSQRTLDDMRRKAIAATFVTDLPPRVHVARIEDDRGHVAFAPFGRRESLLGERIVALFVADYLTRPEYYLTSAARERWTSVVDLV